MGLRSGHLGCLHGAGRALRDALLPPTCASCGTRVGAHPSLCGLCWSDLELIEPPLCRRLGIPLRLDGSSPLPFDVGEDDAHPLALAFPPPWDRARAAAMYRYGDSDVGERRRSTASRLLKGLKYADRHESAALAGRLTARAGRDLLADADVVVPAPMSRWRTWSRRGNHAAELAERVIEASGRLIPLARTALVKRGGTRTQAGLSRAARKRNLRGAIRASPSERDRLRGRRILLIDDVRTTGATAEACVEALLRAGAASADVLTFAYARREDSP